MGHLFLKLDLLLYFFSTIDLAFVDVVLILDADMNADVLHKTHVTNGKLLTLTVKLKRDLLEG